MTRRLLLFGCLFAGWSTGSAQIVGIELSDDAVRKKYAASTITWEGKAVLPGEIVSGIDVDVTKGVIRKSATVKKVVLFVPDQTKPDLEIYHLDDSGAKKVVAKQRQFTLDDKEINSEGLHIIFPYQSLAGFRNDYVKKRGEVEAQRDIVKGIAFGTPQWFAEERKLLAVVQALSGWLRNTVFSTAGERLDKEFATDLKKQGDASSRSRFEIARRSMKKVEIPPALKDVAEKSGNKDLRFVGRETQHFRILGIREAGDTAMEAGVVLGERVLEAFRAKMVEPFLQENEKDPIPDGILCEWFYAPEDETLGTRFFEEYYGKKLPLPREASIKHQGHSEHNAFGVPFLFFWRFRVQQDVDGMVAHELGHALASILYNDNQVLGVPAWISEGLGHWLSFEHLARNTTSCYGFQIVDYARSATKENVRPVTEGLRATFNELALTRGQDFSRMFQLSLGEMDMADLAKSWSLLDFLVVKHRALMRPFLSACCKATDQTGKLNIEQLRPAAEKIFGQAPGTDIYLWLENEWKAFAKGEQRANKKVK